MRQYIIYFSVIIWYLGAGFVSTSYAQVNFVASSSPKGITVFILGTPLHPESPTGWAGYQIYRAKSKDGNFKKVNRKLLSLPETPQDFAKLIKTEDMEGFKENFKTDEAGVFKQFLLPENEENVIFLIGFRFEFGERFGLVYHDEDVKDKTTYYYKVTKVKTDGTESKPSDVFKATVGKPLEKNTPPQDLESKTVGKAIFLQFSKAKEGIFRSVYRSEDSLGTYRRLNKLRVIGIENSDFDSYLDTTVQKSVKYYYTVATMDLFENQYFSDTISHQLKGEYNLEYPQFTTIQLHSAGVELNWEMEFPQGQVVGFEILRRPNVNDSTVNFTKINQNLIPSNVRQYIDQTVTLGTNYQYAVQAVADDEITRLRAIPVGILAERTTRPLPPQNVQIEPLLNAIKISWDSVQGADIAGYMVFRGYSDEPNPETLSDFLPKENTSFIDTSSTLSKNITFAYYVKTFTYNEYESVLSKPVFASPVEPPYKPKIMNSLSGSYSEFKGNYVKWGLPNDQETQFVRLFRSEVDTNYWEQIYTEKIVVGKFQYQDSTRNPLKTYHYKMCAVSFDSLQSDFSDILTIEPEIPDVLPPYELYVEQKNKILKVSWLPVMDDNLKAYALYRQSYNLELEKIAEIPKGTHTFEDKIESSDKYTYFVKSINVINQEGSPTDKISYEVEL